MFARRASWDLAENELSRRVAARRSAGLPILDLTESNPTRCEILGLAAGFERALAELARDPRSARYEPDARGDPDARRAIADYHTARGGATDAGRIVLTAGTSEGYAHLFRLLGDPGDRVLVPTPGYPLFEFLAGLEGLEAASYPYHLDTATGAWRIDAAQLGAALTPRTRALLLVHPGNPTGGFVRRADVAALRALCRRHGLALISDEVFADYPFAEARGDWPASLLEGADVEDGPLHFVLSGASKPLALPQLKVGWIVCAGPRALREEALRRLELVADTYLSVAGPGQLLLPGLLARRDEVQRAVRERVRTQRARLAAALAALGGVTLLPADAGWCAILRLASDAEREAPDEEELVTRLLDDTGVLLHPGFFFELAAPPDAGNCAHLVLSLLPGPAVFEPALASLCRWLAQRGR